MKPSRHHCCFLTLLLLLSLGPLSTPVRADPTVGELRRGNPNFFERHAAALRRAKAGPVGVVFLGDSITQHWEKVPELWEDAWGRYQPANFGISGDRTQHVIWRIEQGELDRISPRVVVLMIGTNNTGSDSAAAITAGIRRIVTLIHEKLPETEILLLGIFPRGPRTNRDGTPDAWQERMGKIRTINNALAEWDDQEHLHYLDLGDRFQEDDGTIPERIMPDQLHLSPAGYKIWADAIAPRLAELMSQSQVQLQTD